MKTRLIVLCFTAVCCCPASTWGQKKAAIDFAAQVQPILESSCLSCHHEKKAEGGLRLDSQRAAITGGENGTALVPHKPEKSLVFTSLTPPVDRDGFMPPEGPPLAEFQREIIKTWIAQGAPWPAEVKLSIQPRIDFAKHIQPILEQNCVSCHRKEKAEGDFDLSSRTTAFSSGSSPAIVAFAPLKSSLYTLTKLKKDDEQLMPPAKSGGPLTKKLVNQLRLWIAQGAHWPREITLKPRAKIATRPKTPDTTELVEKIHALIVKTAKEKPPKFNDYSAKVPKTGAQYHMVAIKGGKFLMGSPANEKHRKPQEGPQVNVEVSPFWIGKCEVTWDEYEPYMITQVDREKHGGRKDFDPNKHGIVDAVSQPTPPYVEMSFGMGQKGFPAISMTQHAANKYCQWLSAQTGHFYRLPTEAEWEYACRAGTTTAYSFGDDPKKLGQYAWYYENSNEKYQKVGKKKPNPWGLHDMHGNVREWTADKFVTDYFGKIKNSPTNPLIKPDKIYPRTIRGGGWDDDAEQLRSAFRSGSDPAWKQQDPQLPKSIWYHTNAQWLGFRIVRPQKIPTVEEMNFYWNSAADK